MTRPGWGARRATQAGHTAGGSAGHAALRPHRRRRGADTSSAPKPSTCPRLAASPTPPPASSPRTARSAAPQAPVPVQPLTALVLASGAGTVLVVVVVACVGPRPRVMRRAPGTRGACRSSARSRRRPGRSSLWPPLVGLRRSLGQQLLQERGDGSLHLDHPASRLQIGLGALKITTQPRVLHRVLTRCA